LDYDGTLTDFKRDPNHSRLSPSAQKVLKRLSRKHPVVFVSGRYLDSLEKVSGLKDFPMVGTHGFEARHLPGGFKLSSPSQEKEFKKQAAHLWSALQELLKEFPAIHIEKKPFSSTLHYRGIHLKASQIQKLRKQFKTLFKKSVRPSQWSLMEGKEMIEAMPKGFSKGQAMVKILKQFPGHFPIYVGDDISDISVFKILGKRGFKVSVGKRIPAKFSDLRLKNPRQLLKWLETF
jgi:trehalose-phosphatase